MGMVQQLQNFHVPFDAEQFIASHKGCPDDAQLLQDLWKLVRPSVFWREEAIQSNDGDIVTLGGGSLSIASCYVAKGLAECSKAVIMALTIGPQLPDEARRASEAGELYRSSVADYLGSHAVEMFADAFCQYLQQQALSKGQ